MKMDVGVIRSAVDQAYALNPRALLAGFAVGLAVKDIPEMREVASGLPFGGMLFRGQGRRYIPRVGFG